MIGKLASALSIKCSLVFADKLVKFAGLREVSMPTVNFFIFRVIVFSNQNEIEYVRTIIYFKDS